MLEHDDPTFFFLFVKKNDGSRNAWNNHFTVCDNTVKCWPVYMVDEKHILGYKCLRPCSGSMETGVTDKAIDTSEYKSVYCSTQLLAAHSFISFRFY